MDALHTGLIRLCCLHVLLQTVLCQLVTEEDAKVEPLIRQMGVAPKDYHLGVLRKVLIPNYCLH